MLKVLSYFKYIGIFVIFIVGISIGTSLINLTGFKPNLINKLAVILTALSFFIVSSMASKNITEKGYILGIKLGLLFVILMILINLIFFKSGFNIDRIIYYTILIISSILGGSFGKNLKIKKLAR
jgi:putative membrane protein (TIGR04086 family)